MTKQLKSGDYPLDYPIALSDLAIGRNWIREKYSSKYEYYDTQAFMFWEDYLSNIALAAFKWENLPAGKMCIRDRGFTRNVAVYQFRACERI